VDGNGVEPEALPLRHCRKTFVLSQSGQFPMEAHAHRFLQGFTPEARERLLGCMIHQNYPDGDFLFHEGAAADGVYLVLDGQVEIVRVAGMHDKILDIMETGDYFGEVAVLDGLGRSTAARARGQTSIAKIPGTLLLEVLATGSGALTLALFQRVLIQLRRATDMYVREVVNKEKLALVGEMANSLMHDLGTPVSNIRLSADLIHSTAGGEKVPRWCNGIRQQCDRIVGMAAELIEFSRGEPRLALTRTTVPDFFDQFKMLNEGFLQPAGMAIGFKAEPVEVEIDVMRMHRVLQNLVTNAIEALHRTPQPRLQVSGWVKDSIFHLTVEDNGPGIPAGIQSRIFEPFVTHGKTKGIGLGMAIVRNIVTAHEGAISFDTAPDRGTIFLVCLPQKSAA
jgi:signal transduction histidine kinase